MKPSHLLALGVAVAGCAAGPPVPTVRFANAPPVAVVNDRLDVAKPPRTHEVLVDTYHYDAIVQRTIERALDLARHRRALGVNAVDEVPNSTWFINRIGVRDLTIDELTNGPLTIESPELHKPWTIKSAKPGAGDVGFVIEDARGEKFLLKFDAPGYEEQETAPHIIVGKILWACGFNVTEDFLVHLRHEDLVIGKGV